MINAYGQLAVDAFPLERFGLAEDYPKLAKLQREVRDLDARRLEAEHNLVALRQGVGVAQRKDAEAGAHAIRAGKDTPPPKHEAAARAQVEEGERRLAALSGAVSSAAEELTAAQREHSQDLAGDLDRARTEAARRVSEQAAKLLRDFGLFHDTADVAKRFAPPAPPPDENAPARNIFMVARGGMANTGPQRGDVETVLGHLVGFASPAGQEAGDDAA